MRDDLIQTLDDCRQFRQTLQARPPAIVHGTALLLAVLVGTALVWSVLTEADLVVRASGLVRPVTATQAVKTRFGGRVVRVCFRQGQRVKKGDLLVQLDTDKLDNDIEKRKLSLRAAEDELAKGAARLESLASEFQAEKATIAAKLAQAREEIKQAGRRRDLEMRQALDELRHAQSEETTSRRLASKRALARVDLEKALAKTHEARTKLAKAQLPVEKGKVTVLRRELTQAGESYRARRQEAQIRQAAKQGEIDVARKELENLNRERAEAAIRAPVDGVVTSEDLHEGDILETGKVVVEVAAQRGFRFEASVPSEEVGHLRVGMPVRVKLDPFDYQRYGTLEGTVCFISPDSKTVEQKGAFYTVKIELHGEEVGRGELRGRVTLGMAGRAEIVTESRSLLALLVKKVRQTISLK
jgi:HlyD family type I secretion membrane fusion protein